MSYTETIEYKGIEIKIIADEDAESPEEHGDESLFLTAFHRDFSVDGPCATIPEHLREVTHKSYCTACYQRNFTTIEATGKRCGKCGKDARVNHTYYRTSKGEAMFTKAECQEIAENGFKHKAFWVFPLEAYIHSGVRLALSGCGNFPDRQWDVSQLGLVFASKREWRLSAKARKAAQSLVDEWNQYLSGDVWGYEVGNDSCWGFYGKAYCIEQAKEAAAGELERMAEEAAEAARCACSDIATI